MTPRVWDQFETWNLVLPPSRPSARELDIIRSRLAPKITLSTRAAVLGSTPEFRDLLHQLGVLNIYVFDSSRKFHEAMNGIRIFSNKDTFIEGDWLDSLPRFPDAFDIILSDLTSGNVPYDKRERFYDLIAGSLVWGGLFYDKVLTHSKELVEVAYIYDKYSRKPINLLHVNEFSCEALFCSELLLDNHIVDSSRFYDLLTNGTSDKVVHAFARWAELITPRGCVWYYGKEWCDLRSSYCSQLTLVATHDDEIGSPYFGRVRLFWHSRDAL